MSVSSRNVLGTASGRATTALTGATAGAGEAKRSLEPFPSTGPFPNLPMPLPLPASGSLLLTPPLDSLTGAITGVAGGTVGCATGAAAKGSCLIEATGNLAA